MRYDTFRVGLLPTSLFISLLPISIETSELSYIAVRLQQQFQRKTWRDEEVCYFSYKVRVKMGHHLLFRQTVNQNCRGIFSL